MFRMARYAEYRTFRVTGGLNRRPGSTVLPPRRRTAARLFDNRVHLP